MYSVNCVNTGNSKDPFVAQISNFALIFGNELDAEVNMLYLVWVIMQLHETNIVQSVIFDFSGFIDDDGSLCC